MNEPRDHHYIPQFYLKNWSGPDGRVVYYKRIPTGAVVKSRVAPKSTGYERDLYTLAHLPEDLRQAMEKNVTRDVDNRAATALQKMAAAKSTATLTQDDRLGFAQFIVSLPIRNPEAVADIKETSPKKGMDKAFEWAKARFPDWAQADDFRAEFEESVNADPVARFLSGNYGLLIIGELMLNRRYQDIILGMKWWVMDFAQADINLITCDRPYMPFRSINDPRCLIYVPIGPSLAFYASPDPRKERQLAQDAKETAKVMNRSQARLAAKFIYAADSQHTPLVEKWLRAC